MNVLEDRYRFTLLCRSGDEFDIRVPKEQDRCWFSPLTNLDKLARDRYGEPTPTAGEDEVQHRIRKYLAPDCLVIVKGIFQESEDKRTVSARQIYLLYEMDGEPITNCEMRDKELVFETSSWWIQQIKMMGDTWLHALFRDGLKFDFSRYQTNLDITNAPSLSGNTELQEMATLSRLIYGFSSAYMLTGAQRFLDAATEGVKYQREFFRSYGGNGQYILWAYGKKGPEIIIPSLNGDDKNTLPLYEQIYALAGLAQYYRITLDWETLDDIRRTVKAFQDIYYDVEGKGYFSHIDYASLRPDSDSLNLDGGFRDNRKKKNWNSIGDHIPAYLVNLILALEPVPESSRGSIIQDFVDTCKSILEETSTIILKKFPEKLPNGKLAPFVNERFDEHWEPDKKWGWQQDRAIVGHNLKIAWNLTRVANYYTGQSETVRPTELVDLAEHLAESMIKTGAVDLYRGGCFDAVERIPENEMPIDFAWLNTKDFWQQEQGILAYLILYGRTENRKYLDIAREMMAFWNAFFLDRDRGGVFFRTSDNGDPNIFGEYGQKGGHAISGYHVFELNYLAHIYIMTYVHKKNFCLYFKPNPHCRQQAINVLPDFIEPEKLRISRVTIDGLDLDKSTYNPSIFQIELENGCQGQEIQVEFEVIDGKK